MKFSLVLLLVASSLVIQAQVTYGWTWDGTGTDDAAYDLMEFKDSTIVAAGKFTKLNEVSAGGTYPLVAIYRKNFSGDWKWEKLGIANGNIQDIESYGGALYVGGRFNLAGSSLNPAYGIVKYDGTWSAVTNGGVSCQMNVSTCGVWALKVFNGSLIAGGTFTAISGTPLKNIAAWDGSTWSALGGGISSGSIQDGVRVMEVYNNDLYVAGSFNNAGGAAVQNIAKWNGSSWSVVAGFSATDQIACMQAHNGMLYVGGNFSSVNGTPVNRLAKFDGTTWTDAGQGLQNCGFVSSIAVLDDSLYVAGSFNFPGSTDVTSHVGRWNGNSWEFFGAFSKGFGSGSLATVRAAHGRLYASGSFSAVDGKVHTNLARYTPARILAGVNDNDILSRFSVFPNPISGWATLMIPDELKNTAVTIENVLGVRVKTINPEEGLIIYGHELPAGVYYLCLQNGNTKYSRKIVVAPN